MTGRLGVLAVGGFILVALAIVLPAWIAEYARLTAEARPPATLEPASTAGPSPPPLLPPDQLAIAFDVPGERGTSWGRVTLRTERIAELVLPTGRIGAADAFFLDGETVLATLPPGRYPVEVLIARDENADERVAAARVVVPGERPTTWELALLPGQDPSTLGPGEYFGYGVDSGTGSFFSPEAGGQVDFDDYADRVIEELEQRQVMTWAWADVTVDPASGANVLAFSSGIGDGAYPSFVGYVDGRAVAFMTDFTLLDAP